MADDAQMISSSSFGLRGQDQEVEQDVLLDRASDADEEPKFRGNLGRFLNWFDMELELVEVDPSGVPRMENHVDSGEDHSDIDASLAVDVDIPPAPYDPEVVREVVQDERESGSFLPVIFAMGDVARSTATGLRNIFSGDVSPHLDSKGQSILSTASTRFGTTRGIQRSMKLSMREVRRYRTRETSRQMNLSRAYTRNGLQPSIRPNYQISLSTWKKQTLLARITKKQSILSSNQKKTVAQIALGGRQTDRSTAAVLDRTASSSRPPTATLSRPTDRSTAAVFEMTYRRTAQEPTFGEVMRMAEANEDHLNQADSSPEQSTTSSLATGRSKSAKGTTKIVGFSATKDGDGVEMTAFPSRSSRGVDIDGNKRSVDEVDQVIPSLQYYPSLSSIGSRRDGDALLAIFKEEASLDAAEERAPFSRAGGSEDTNRMEDVVQRAPDHVVVSRSALASNSSSSSSSSKNKNPKRTGVDFRPSMEREMRDIVFAEEEETTTNKQPSLQPDEEREGLRSRIISPVDDPEDGGVEGRERDALRRDEVLVQSSFSSSSRKGEGDRGDHREDPLLGVDETARNSYSLFDRDNARDREGDLEDGDARRARKKSRRRSSIEGEKDKKDKKSQVHIASSYIL
ncbi:unnamed protein product [Amoebophrya sp. A25]|nr:unnamed protein product [Amoebophrya sp. A25]|eukprot:GSA25T00018496001.1